jgi:hypothetical protein
MIELNNVDYSDLKKFINENISEFHKSRVQAIKGLKLKDMLKRKNPYLFKAKNILTSEQIIRNVFDAYLSSQEETLFGNFLEKVAIFVCSKVYEDKKSTLRGMDLEFEKDSKLYIVSIKSGPNWANSDQTHKMIENFKEAKDTFKFKDSSKEIIAVNGCCYGKCYKINDEYVKICGKKFWELISGDSMLFIKIIEPLGYKAKQRNKEFLEEYSKVINKFALEFGNDFSNEDGSVNWGKWVNFVSGDK